jgi:hypothetical protein
LERISTMFQKVLDFGEIIQYKPDVKPKKIYTLSVPDTDFSYRIAIGEQMPTFTFVPEG